VVLDAGSRTKLSLGWREDLLGWWPCDVFFDAAKCGGKCNSAALQDFIIALDISRGHITALALDPRPVQVLWRHVLTYLLDIFLVVLLLAAVEADDHAVDID
jgi:hypothetical protein